MRDQLLRRAVAPKARLNGQPELDQAADRPNHRPFATAAVRPLSVA